MAYDDHEFATWCWPNGCAETSTNQSQLVIADPSHPMAAGLTGTVTVSTGASKFSWGGPASSADVIATVVGDSSKSPIFAYDTGDAMDGGFVAPARRVGFFFTYATSQHTNSNGWALFDAAINWLTGTGGPSNTAPTVNAGNPASVQVSASHQLAATVTDDGLPTGSTVTYAWTTQSAPAGGTASFSSTSVEDPTVSFDTAGSYTLRLTADDSELSDFDDVTITVTSGQGSQGNSRVTTDLLALYEFEETSGSTVADTSNVGAPMDLTISNTGVTNWTGDALEVNGDTLISSNGAASKINTAVAASGEITVEAWIEPANVTQNGPARIVTVSASPFARNVTLGQGVWSSSGDRLEARLRATGTGTNGTPATQTAVGTLDTQLQHVVFTRDDTGATAVYIDNIAVATSTASGDLSNWDATMGFGLAAELDNSRFWHGDFHLVAVYDRALTSAEVSQNFAAGADPSSSPPPAKVTTTSYYTFGGAMIGFATDGTLTTSALNHLGSTEITNTGGTTQRQTYLPFGGVRSSAANALGTDHTYTGQVDDGLGWMHYRARQYDPVLGRFMQADSLVVDGLNRYTYALNNPLLHTDPSGKAVFVPVVIIGIGAAGVVILSTTTAAPPSDDVIVDPQEVIEAWVVHVQNEWFGERDYDLDLGRLITLAEDVNGLNRLPGFSELPAEVKALLADAVLHSEPSEAAGAGREAAEAWMPGDVVPPPEPQYRDDGRRNSGPGAFVNVRHPDGSIETVAQGDGNHAEINANELVPGGQMSSVWGWRGPSPREWVEIPVCAECQNPIERHQMPTAQYEQGGRWGTGDTPWAEETR